MSLSKMLRQIYEQDQGEQAGEGKGPGMFERVKGVGRDVKHLFWSGRGKLGRAVLLGTPAALAAAYAAKKIYDRRKKKQEEGGMGA